MGSCIELHRVTVTYGRASAPALDAVSLSIPASSLMVILGPSGCGKSTLLSCLAGFTSVDDGRITVDGQPIRGPGPDRGVVFQRDVLYPWKTIRQNIEFALKPTRLPRKLWQARTLELLEMVKLDPSVAHRYPHELSGGMRQRVGIARMLAAEPRTMLMDEPFAALDAQTRIQMQDLVTDLWHRLRATIVFVTHDVDEALRLADLLVVMGRGGCLLENMSNPLSRPRPAARLGEMAGYPELRRRHHHLLGLEPAVSTHHPH